MGAHERNPPPMIALLVMTDGRPELIDRTIASAMAELRGPITERWIHDDSGSGAHRRKLEQDYPTFQVIHGGSRLGFGGAIANAWTILRRHTRARFVFHLEDDFTFRRPVDLLAMAEVLEVRRHLVQLALRRQPWNDQERLAGGIVEMHPTDWQDHRIGEWQWLESQRNFTTNPSLYPAALMARGWPEERHSEGIFGIRLLAEHPDARFGYWGARDSGEWVEHIGTARAGIGY